MYPRLAAVALVATLLLPAAALGDVTLSGAWVRAMPAAQSMTAGYLRLENSGDSAMTVIGATSDASPRVEIHTTVSRDGMQRMQRVESLDVAAGESVELAPGGYHLMLRDMPNMPAEGDTVVLCLELYQAEPVCTTAVISRNGPGATSHHH